MQQKINTGKAEILVIGLPKDASNLELQKDECGSYLVWKRSTGAWNCSDNLPEGNLNLLSTYPDNLTEEMADDVVMKISGCFSGNLVFEKQKFFNYKAKSIVKTALESFATLMEDNQCHTVNPMGSEPIESNYNLGDIHSGFFRKKNTEWQEAQSRTFDKWAVILINENK